MRKAATLQPAQLGRPSSPDGDDREKNDSKSPQDIDHLTMQEVIFNVKNELCSNMLQDFSRIRNICVIAKQEAADPNNEELLRKMIRDPNRLYPPNTQASNAAKRKGLAKSYVQVSSRCKMTIFNLSFL